VQLLHQFESFIDRKKTFRLSEVGMGGVVELAHEIVELLCELAVII